MHDFSFHEVFGKVIKSHFHLMQNELDKKGLYPGQPQLLMALRKFPGSSQRDLATKLKVQPATINVMIKRLEKSNFLFKEFDKNDARISKIFLSEKGLSICDEITILFKNINDICLRDFSESEKDTLKNLLRKININLENNRS